MIRFDRFLLALFLGIFSYSRLQPIMQDAQLAHCDTTLKTENTKADAQALESFIGNVQSLLPPDLFSSKTQLLIKQELISYCTKHIKPFTEATKILRSINDFSSKYGNYLKKRVPELSEQIKKELSLLSQGKVSLESHKRTDFARKFFSNIRLDEHRALFLYFLRENVGEYLSVKQYAQSEKALMNIESSIDYLIEKTLTAEDKKVLLEISNLYWFNCLQKINYRLFFSHLKDRLVREYALSSFAPELIKKYLAQLSVPAVISWYKK